MLEQADAVAHRAHRRRRVRDEQDRLARREKLRERPPALVLEFLVADGKNLVQQEDVGIQIGGDGETEPHLHPRRVILQRHVHEVAQPRVVHDGGVESFDRGTRQAVDGRVEEDVFAAAQLRMEADAQLDERADARPARDPDVAAGRLVDPGDELQQRALPRSVAADHADRLPLADRDRHVAQGPQLVPGFPAILVEQAEEAHLQLAGAVAPQPIPLGYVVQLDDGAHHNCSVNCPCTRVKSANPPMSATPAYTIATAAVCGSGHFA